MNATTYNIVTIENASAPFDQYIEIIERIKAGSIQNDELLDWCNDCIDMVIESFGNYSLNEEVVDIKELENIFDIISRIKVEDLDANLSLVKSIVNTLKKQDIQKLENKHVKKTFEIVKDFYLYYLCYRKIDKYNCDDLYIVLNKCIVLDHISWHLPVLSDLIIDKLNPLVLLSNCSNYLIWKNCALLNFKIHRYSEAIVFFEKSELLLRNQEYDKYELIDIKIQKGYCFEYSHEFDKAIGVFSELEKELERNNKNLEINRDKLHEVYHALGHCYNEKSIQDQEKIDTSDGLKRARKYLTKAASVEKYSKYKSCLGTIRSEYNEQIKAIKIYEEAEGEIKDNNESVKNELLFYKGYSYYCLDDFENAEKNYNSFEEYCNSIYEKDGLAHSAIFKIKLELRKNNLSDINQSKIQSWVDELISRKPSVYVNESIHDEWHQIINFLKALYHIQSIINKEKNLIDSFGTIIYYLKLCKLEGRPVCKVSKNATNLKVLDLNKIPIYLLTDKKNKVDYLRELKNNKELGYTSIKNLNIDAGDLYKNFSERDINNIVIHIQDIKNDDDLISHIKHISEQEKVNYIIYDKNVDYLERMNKNGVFDIRRRNSSIVTFSNIADAIKASYILNALERIRLDLIASKFFFVLTPLRESSVYDYQTGQINTLCWDKYDKKASQTGRFANQIKNIDTWYTERRRIYSENNTELKEYFNSLTNNIPKQLQQGLKLSIFYPLETSKKDYRISIKSKNGEIECVKPLLNKNTIDNVLKNIKDSLYYNKEDGEFSCITNHCKGMKSYCCSKHFSFDFEKLKTEKIRDPFELLINNIPDLPIEQESNSLVWLKYFNQESVTENFKAGLLILIFDSEQDIDSLNIFCEKQSIHKISTEFELNSQANEILEGGQIAIAPVLEVSKITIDAINKKMAQIYEIILRTKGNEKVVITHEKCCVFYERIKNEHISTEEEHNERLHTIIKFMKENNIKE